MNDLKFAFRQLLKNPGFTAVAVLTLALGIGVTTAIVSVVRTALFDPLPVQYPERFLALAAWSLEGGERAPGLNAVAAREVEANLDLFQLVALWEHDSLTLEGGDFPTPLDGLRATGDFFEMFSVTPLLGRLPGPDDAAAGAEPVVVLSHALWRNAFGGDPSIVGRPIRFKEDTATVIGVMPPHFSFPTTYTGYWRPWPGPAVQAGEVIRFGRSGSLPNTGVITKIRVRVGIHSPANSLLTKRLWAAGMRFGNIFAVRARKSGSSVIRSGPASGRIVYIRPLRRRIRTAPSRSQASRTAARVDGSRELDPLLPDDQVPVIPSSTQVIVATPTAHHSSLITHHS